MRASRLQHRGFTLVEAAMVVVIVGLVAGMVYPAMLALRASTQRAATETALQGLARATAAFVTANGCVPCPTPGAVSGPEFGRVPLDSQGLGLPCGACSSHQDWIKGRVPEGIPPFISLGLPASAARDGWGLWITMRVDPALTGAFGVAPPFTPCTTADVTAHICATVGGSTKGLCKSGLSKTGAPTVQLSDSTQQSVPPPSAAVVFVSHGPNGYGAFLASALSNGLNGERLSFPEPSSASEVCNADGNTSFCDYPQGANFDDRLLYFDRNALVSFLGQGACSTTW